MRDTIIVIPSCSPFDCRELVCALNFKSGVEDRDLGYLTLVDIVFDRSELS